MLKMIISGALRIASTVALEIILYLLPPDLYCKGMAARVSRHASSIGQMKLISLKKVTI